MAIRNLPAPATSQKTYFDDAIPGFGVRVSQGGSRSFILQVRNPRKLVTIGRFGIVSLSQARDKARTILARRQLGEAEQPEGIPFPVALEQFLDAYRRKNKPSTVHETERLLKYHLTLTGDVAAITTRDLTRIIDAIEKPSAQHHAFVAIKTLFNWLAKRRIIPSSPMSGVEAPNRPTARERVLSDTEIISVLKTAEKHNSWRFTAIVKLLILTGQRLGQIGALQGEWIDHDTRLITFPGSVMKSGRQHQTPFGETTAAILAPLPARGLLFPTLRGLPYNNWSTATRKLDELCPIPHWTLHDLRRTFATGLAQQGIAPHIIERLLAHSSGSISGVAAIYNRHHFLPEMRLAVDLWDSYLTQLAEKNPCE